jgi:TRAP-type uncharacterized transport system substrate-binding protein
MNTGRTFFVWGAAVAVALAVAVPIAAQQPNRISITTGGTGGVYYPMGGGMANVLSKYVPGLQATAEVTGGSVDSRWRTPHGRRRRAPKNSKATKSTCAR